MRRAAAIMGSVALSLVAAAVVLTAASSGSSQQRASAESRRMPIVIRCPRPGDRPGLETLTSFPASADQVIEVARRVNHREVTHYQGRAERRTRWNTAVHALVMNLGDDSLRIAGRQALAARAKSRCGRLGLATSAVTFHDGLSPICCNTFTLFVAMGSRAWIVFRA